MLDSDRSPIATDERGWPKISGIHDARLNRLAVDFGRGLSFEMTGEHDECRTFFLDALYLLRFDGHWDDSIIDSISIWDVADSIGGRSDDVSRAWRAILADRVHAGAEAEEVERLRRRHGKLSLVSVSCSYGGEMQALCRDVLIDGRRVVAARRGSGASVLTR